MASNPSKQNPILNPATKRGSRINDPAFTLQQGYSPFDLSHQEMLTARFGEYTPSLHLDTIPADRFLLNQNYKAIHNRIDGNLLSTINQYDETFYVSIQNLIPNAYERFIPNPVKGDDLPNSALPQVPIGLFFANLMLSTVDINLKYYINSDPNSFSFTHRQLLGLIDQDLYENMDTIESQAIMSYKIGFMTMIAYVLSRGQLLDFFGFQLDDFNDDENSIYNSRYQQVIDNYFSSLYIFVQSLAFGKAIRVKVFNNEDEVLPTKSHITLTTNNFVFRSGDFGYSTFKTKSDFRGWLQDCFEAGDFPLFVFQNDLPGELIESYNALRSMFDTIFAWFYDFDENDETFVDIPSISDVDAQADPFRVGFINALKPLAYQLIVAQYCTNDHIDNIYTADLYQQNLRSVMFPANDGLSQEPIYTYNGVQFEYDLMTFGAWRRSFLDPSFMGSLSRSFVFMSLMFVLRRSLRYGDYFATGRPNMLAVGDLYINVEDGKISPVVVTKNLLMQRFLNAANHLGQRVDSLYAAVYGVVPSDRPVCPRYVSHRKTTLVNQITNNTADEQGKQTTNLVAYNSKEDEDNNVGVDLFLDDYGVIISIVSYDVLPVYTSGIDRSFMFSDRFDYYNPQLQNIGDQPILQSEMFGQFSLSQKVFAYQMRNAEYKYKVSRAHGGLVNDLPGYIFRYPPQSFRNKEISPDFIRDKPMYFDQLAKLMTGDSPANYYHFIVSVQNDVKSARIMQATPPILF